MKKSIWIVSLSCILLIQACGTVPVPHAEYTLARTALEAARVIDAGRYSPGFWSEAENSYSAAVVAYKENDYGTAAKLFKKARESAEKAENTARLKKQQNGDFL